MIKSLKWLGATAAASAGALILSTGALAADHHTSSTSQSSGSERSMATIAKGCDVPGASCDPSKTDHDNGVGNNCDPGYGRGNQRKMPPDEASTSCRTKASSAERSGSTNGESEQGASEESSGKRMGESTEAPENLTLTASGGEVEGMRLEKVMVREIAENEFELTLIRANTETTVVHVIRHGNRMEAKLNGETIPANMNAQLQGLLARFEAGELNLGNGQVRVSELPGGAFSITLPNGTVLSLNAGVLSAQGKQLPAGSTATLAGLPVSNVTAPSGGTLGASGMAATTGTSATGQNRGGANGNAGVGGVLGAAENAAAGAPLAATGLPILAGLVGLILFGFGAAVRRRR